MMGLISSVALLMPIVLILSFRLATYRTFPALLSYYVLFFIYNLLTEGYLHFNNETVQAWNVGKSLLEGPLMLVFLAYFSTSALYTRKLKIGLGLMIAFELIVVVIEGFSNEALTIILAPVLLSIFFFSAYLFIRLAKISVTHGKASGRATITAAILFAYGCFTMIYLMYMY